ncbi:hypothetical protein ACFPZ0_28020 [Streptomonospora nanhaiensis]|uniref:hypothetical protein n=1 Tax=Streptomonospora nanhaiensis TaxID=1323731 RepID=UPI001C9973B1|nr:hypothetical protein [Streptomonospora nanhaiensis]MBX9388226.1 hypothetical protein [Streptomonospora nanhaiensis]
MSAFDQVIRHPGTLRQIPASGKVVSTPRPGAPPTAVLWVAREGWCVWHKHVGARCVATGTWDGNDYPLTVLWRFFVSDERADWEQAIYPTDLFLCESPESNDPTTAKGNSTPVR